MGLAERKRVGSRRDAQQAEGPDATYSDALTERQRRLLRRRTDGIAVFLAGPANVAMQLASYPVGRGVAESTVHSGSVYRHPFKRFRTTVGYLDIALYADVELRSDYRKAVNGSHRQVRSTAASPVEYNAFDRDLQLWVASCLYYGVRDIFVLMHGPMTEQEEADLLSASARLGTTLQVPADRWHADRAAFEAYWAQGMADLRFDDRTRAYVLGVINQDILPTPLNALARPLGRFFSTGFLPPQIRDELGLEWTDRQDRAFRRSLRTLGAIGRRFPHAVRRVPMNLMTLDIRARRALKRPLV